MARHTYFGFDFDDVRAANIVRNSNVVPQAGGQMAFRDYSLYEKVKANDATIKRAIDDGLERTTVTVIINGAQTWTSRWVRYEIAKSLERGNGLVVINVDGVGLEPTPTKGPNPLDYLAAYPWSPHTLLGGEGFSIRQWEAVLKAWVEFKQLPSVSNATAKYPSPFVSGDPYKLSVHFNRRRHWNDVKTNFNMILDQAARDAGHTVWL
jgi:hypothetical protein